MYERTLFVSRNFDDTRGGNTLIHNTRFSVSYYGHVLLGNLPLQCGHKFAQTTWRDATCHYGERWERLSSVQGFVHATVGYLGWNGGI